MKKFTIIGLAICLAFALAAPVMAVDVDFSGDYRARGFYTSHWDLDDNSASNAYMDMRFRLQTVFKASDILSVTTRFDALDDKRWGEGAGTVDNIDFDRAYMTIKAPIGTFFVGRMKGGAFGTTFVDTEGDRDRIIYAKVIDNLTFKALYQKSTENDDRLANRKAAYLNAYVAAIAAGATPAAADAAGNIAYDAVIADAADEDRDFYALIGVYKMVNITAGLLAGFDNNKTADDETTRVYHLNPYFLSKFGPLAIQGELYYKWGETEYDTNPITGVKQADLDIKQLAYNLEATYGFGPASVMAGYAFISGDDGTDPNENSNFGTVGADWEKLFILTYDETPVNVLGGFGNLSQDLEVGAKIIYGGATFSPLDNLELGVVVGSADADEVPTGVEDDFGVEYDLTLNWKIYDNLTYTAIAAFLDAGDIWKVGFADVEIENTYALFHQLELAF
jgi:hypothetical protein